jgi:hypothetical protein
MHSARAADSTAASEVPWLTHPGGGAPAKLLLDNNSLRVTLISYPAGFHRKGGLRRPYDTLLAYIDEGDYRVIPRARAGSRPRAGANPAFSRREGQPAQCDPVKDCGPIGPEGTYAGHPLPPGTITYHPKGNVTPGLVVGHAYRVLYIEVKR